MLAVPVRIVIVALVGVAGFVLGKGGERRSEGVPPGTLKPVSALPGAMKLPEVASDFELAMSIWERVEQGAGSASAWRAVQRLPPDRRATLGGVVIEWWAREDPQGALGASGLGYDDANKVYSIWAERDPEGALASARKMRQPDIAERFEESIVAGLARTDRAAAVALAQREGIGFGEMYFSDWRHRESMEEIAAAMVSGAAAGIYKEGHFDKLSTSMEDNAEAVPVFEALLERAGGWRNAALAELLDEMLLVDPESLIQRAVADRDWAGEEGQPLDLFRAWSGVAPELARAWFGRLADDDSLRVELASEALVIGAFANWDEAEQLVEFLPAEIQSDAVYSLLRSGAHLGVLKEQLAFVERWRLELGPYRFDRALSGLFSSFLPLDADSFTTGLELAERYDMRALALRRFVDDHPELAAPLLVSELAPDDRESLMAPTLEEFLEQKPGQALEWIPSLSEAGDIVALEEALAEARISAGDRERAEAILEELRR